MQSCEHGWCKMMGSMVAAVARGGAKLGLQGWASRATHHREEEARRHLRVGRARVEHGGRRVGEPTLGHEVVRLDGRVDVLQVNADRHAHQHVLRPLNHLRNPIARAPKISAAWPTADGGSRQVVHLVPWLARWSAAHLPVHLEQVRALERLEAEEVVIEVAIVAAGGIHSHGHSQRRVSCCDGRRCAGSGRVGGRPPRERAPTAPQMQQARRR